MAKNTGRPKVEPYQAVTMKIPLRLRDLMLEESQREGRSQIFIVKAALEQYFARRAKRRR